MKNERVILEHQRSSNHSTYHGDKKLHYEEMNSIGDVMVNALDMSAVDRGFEPRSAHTKDYKILIYKDWLSLNRDKISEWSEKSNRGLLFQ